MIGYSWGRRAYQLTTAATHSLRIHHSNVSRTVRCTADENYVYTSEHYSC